ncbi:fimbrial protein [Pantoea stewartii]|uniref:fimbrial protein n=1 Tax=Pantoea stewartii TaxID=66269 RepID=UPI001980BF4C|nr:fimbrial protein [Pantoea stewartii]
MKTHAAIFPLLAMMFFASSAFGKCTPERNIGTPGDDSNGGIPLIFGSIKLQPADFMPDGLIGTTHVTVGQAQAFAARQGPDTLLYTCELADEGQTYEAFATNGDSNVGGNISAGDGIYQTYFPFIGIKLIRDKDGKVFSRYWQKSPITGHREGNKLKFYARDFSSVTAEIYRLSETLRGGDPSHHFGCEGPAGDYSRNISYSCPQPNGYTVFVGPGWNSDRNINPGTDSNYNFGGFSNWNWIGFGMQYSTANIFTHTDWGCRVYSYPHTVLLPTVTVAALKSDMKTGSTFNITYRCGGPIIAQMINSLAGRGGPGTDKISVAFKTTNPHPLSPYWTPYLISDNAGQDGYASNVGINIDIPGVENMLGFVTGDVPADGMPATARGWVSPLSGEVSRQVYNTQSMDITSQYFASYAVLNPADPVTPGKVDATAYITVRYW